MQATLQNVSGVDLHLVNYELRAVDGTAVHIPSKLGPATPVVGRHLVTALTL